MILYMKIFISWLLAGFSSIWKCNPYQKSTKIRKDSEYRKTSTLNEIPLTKSCSPKLEKSSNQKKESNYKMALHRFSPFPLLEGLTPKKNANLIVAEPTENCNSVDIMKVVTPKNKNFKNLCDKVITLSDTEDSNELYEVTTHNDNILIHYSI